MSDHPPAPDPPGFPRDDRRIYDMYVAGRQSAALAVGVRLGFFDLLDREPLSAAGLERRLDANPRALRALLASYLAMGLVERDGDRWRLAPDASAYLVRGKPGWLGGLVELEVEHFLSPRSLLDALRADGASVYGGKDPWEAHAEDPEQARRFTAAMHSVSERAASGLAAAVDFGGVRSLLDVGGGSGALSIAIARAWPEVRCTVLEIPAVCPVAREYAEAAGVADRVVAEPGDMFGDELPRGHDAVLLSQILHDWPPERDAELLAKAHAAMTPGGLLLVHEKLVDDDGRGPLANVLVNLDMLVWTEGQQLTPGELAALIEGAGFPRETVETRPTAGYWSVTLARKVA
jgi:acetylserotonin N-methyltransferase